MNKKEVLLTLARAAIAEELGIPYEADIEQIRAENPWLEEQGAVFVTLNTASSGALRGCIGSIIAHQSLFDDLMQNARSAAFGDPRFNALDRDEFRQITVEVSLLTPPQFLPYDSIEELKAKIRIGTDGVILKSGMHQATFLPQVWEQLPTFELFMSHLCQKAGMEPGCLEREPEIFVYQVEEYHE
jgi:AmmeMemoRadiSam system protein A